MLRVVGSGLLIVEDRTLGNALPIALNVQFFRLCGDCRQRDPLLVFAEYIDTPLDQVQRALPQARVDFLL